MTILDTTGWQDYALLDTGEGRRLERFGEVILDRPDPQILWQKRLSASEWKKASSTFTTSKDDKGRWQNNTSLPNSWVVSYNQLKFSLKLTPFKHIGIFPEQQLNWDFISEQSKTNMKVLNLFGYTGGSSLAAATAGAQVTHVDASKATVTWARENQQLSGLADKPIRWIVDDALKFCEREVRRGNSYDAIIMDPPIYGHGPDGETWDLQKDLPRLMYTCSLLAPKPNFFLVNAYAISASALMLKNLLADFWNTSSIECGELALKEESAGRLLSTGIFARFTS